MFFTTLLALFYGFSSIAKAGTTYCYNEDSCEDEDIDSTVADCYGYYGCEGANLTSSYAYDFGAYSNYDGHCDDSYVWAYGMLSNYYSDVNTYALYAYGYLSAYEADISPVSSTLYAYFYGYYSGYHADVLCYSGDTCKVFCGSSYGCADLDMYCYSGAYCYYDCKNDTDYCPTLYSGIGSQIAYETGLTEIEEEIKLKNKIHDSLTDDEITSLYMKDQAISDAKKGKENIESVIAELTKIGTRAGYAKEIETPTIQVDSINEHLDRVTNKKTEKSYENRSTLETYGYAMIFDAGLLFVVFAIYKCLFKKSNKDDVIFDNEDTPFVNQSNTVAL